MNGGKRWIGQATFADYIIIWARNAEEGNKVQGFIILKGSQGLKTTKMERKMSNRMIQNTIIEMENVFVADDLRLTHATDFERGTNSILRTSRI